MIVIKNGKIIENNKLIKKDILVDHGIIEKIEDNIDIDCETIDAKHCLVMPGGIDVHVHFREPGYEYKETIHTGTLSAAKGGITTVMTMPNLKPCPDCLENVKIQQRIINDTAVVHVYPYGSVSKNEEDESLSDIEAFYKEVLAISDDGKGVNNIELLEKAMILAKKYDLIIASHAEDSIYKFAPQGEYVAVKREIELAKKIGCRYHFCHLSTKESLEYVRQARKEGYKNITCEVSPHHLVLNETMIQDGNWKMNPPLRSEIDRLATVEALIDGTVSMVASDHAPHSKEEKAVEYSKCLNGIIGLETMLPIIYTQFVKTGKISLERFLDLMVYEPIRIFHLPKRRLEVGYPADIAVLDIETPHTYEESEIVSKGKNSPFIGNTYYGFNCCTLVDGKIIYRK